MYGMMGVGRSTSILTLAEYKNQRASDSSRVSFKGLVARILTRRSSKGRERESPSTQLPELAPKKVEPVPRPRVVRRSMRKEYEEYRKSVVELEKPMDGVGLATGNGDGDMRGVFIKDFAYELKEKSASTPSSVVELE